MSVNKSVRAAHCNVQIYTRSFLVATIFQRDGMLRVKDVVHELGLCLLFNKPDDDAALWQPALLPNDGKLIILDQQDISEFPTPSSNETVKYDYVYHSTSGCARQDLHDLEDTCITRASLPKAQRDPRYMAIGKASTDERHHRLPTRTSSLKRRSASSSRTSSPSPTRTEILDVEIPPIVSLSEGRSVMNSFRDDVWKQSGHGCAITREGNLNGSPSPGVEAAHIVPQSHWHVFPMSDEQDIADPNNDTDLIYAWKGTWTPHANGIMLESTLHRCFDARLISIHPETRKIRAFINLGLITKFHGQTATLPDDIPKKVLQHHWDMCCLENTVAPDVPFPLKVLTDVPQLPPRAKFLKASEGDPSKQPSNPGTPSYPDAPPSGTTSSGGKFSSPPSYQAIAHPPSPPASDPGAEERISWPFGEGIIKSPGAAQPLIEDASDHEAHGHSRGRSRQKKRCVATEDNGEHGVKRQRLE